MAKITRLPNGITVICEEMPQAGRVSMNINFKSGSRDEKLEEAGINCLMVESLFTGTTTRTREQLIDESGDKGTSLDGGTDFFNSTFGATVLARYTKDVFGLLSDVILNPAFDADEVANIKRQIDQARRQAESKSDAVAGRKFFQSAYGVDSSFYGTQASMDSITIQRLKEKHAEFLSHPENIVISVAGSITAAEAEKMALEYFGHLNASAQPAPVPAPLAFKGGDYREANANPQTWLQFGFEAPSFNDPERFAYSLLSEALGGGMSCPLFQETREKRALVYSPHAYFTPQEATGLFRITADPTKGNAGEFMTVVMGLLGDVVHNGIGQQELDEARERIVREIRGAREGIDNVASANLGDVVKFGRLKTPEEAEENYKRVTVDDLRRAAAKMLASGNYALSGVGPQDTMPTPDNMKAMMTAQVEGVSLPPAVEIKATAKGTFAGAGKKSVAEFAPKVTVLKNGMTVMTVERPGNMVCGAWVGVGSDNETPVLNGATHVMEHMMFKGTPSFKAGEISKMVEGKLGGGLNAFTSSDMTAYYYFNLEPSAMDTIVKVCGEMIFQATYDNAEFDGKMLPKDDGTLEKAKGERDVIINELNNGLSNPSRRAFYAMKEAAYPNQPHGRMTIGTEEVLRKLTVEQLVAYRDEFYVPNNVIFCLAGPVKHEDFVAAVEKQWGHMVANDNAPLLPEMKYQGGRKIVELETAKACTAALNAEGVGPHDPDVHAYNLLGALLTESTTMGISRELVYEKKIAASAEAGMYEFRNGGTFLARFTAEADQIKACVETVYQQLRVLTADVNLQELERVKLKTEVAMQSIDTNDDVIRKYAGDVLTYGKPQLPEDQIKKMRAVTAEDIKRVAAKILASNPTFVAVVPKGTDQSLLPSLAEVVAMRDGKAPAAPKATKAAKGPKAG